jgi:prepilin-type N-terminal cleavage/methylation domain-containing protein
MKHRVALRRNIRGFSLIELLVVTVILGLVISVIGACLASGIRVWDASRDFNTAEVEGVIAFQSMERDLVNQFPFYAIGFTGNPTEMSFVGLVQVHGDEQANQDKADSQKRVGTIKYSFDIGRNDLLRREWAYPGTEPDMSKAERIASFVQDMSLEYYRIGGERKDAGVWQESWSDPTNLPAAVRISLSVTNHHGSVPLRIVRTVILPLGGRGTQ